MQSVNLSTVTHGTLSQLGKIDGYEELLCGWQSPGPYLWPVTGSASRPFGLLIHAFFGINLTFVTQNNEPLFFSTFPGVDGVGWRVDVCLEAPCNVMLSKHNKSVKKAAASRIPRQWKIWVGFVEKLYLYKSLFANLFTYANFIIFA